MCTILTVNHSITMWKKQGAATCSTGQENVVNKMFILSLGNWIKLESTPQSQAVCIWEDRPLTQPITAHLVPERHNTVNPYKAHQFNIIKANKYSKNLKVCATSSQHRNLWWHVKHGFALIFHFYVGNQQSLDIVSNQNI